MLEYEILARGLYRPDQVRVTYDPALRMPITPAIQSWMDDYWERRLAIAKTQGYPLFDTPLYRYISVETCDDSTLQLLVGDTGYKEYVTTRAPEFFNGRGRQELGNALSVCSVVETSDGLILLDKRQGVDVYAGRYHVIGGYFERDRDNALDGQPDPFAAMRREIREETGITGEDIQEQFCLGLVYDVATPHAELCFLTRLGITLAETQTRVPEEDEIKQLETLQVTTESLRAFLLTHHGHISATGEPNLLLYGALLFGHNWMDDIVYRWSK
ncbi:MAG TPA: NUDIX hydrolase [Ktedonobacteraceae bacterium]|nr:NUDIX hydrolase [Ktedonobacteraceae bacterium]